MNAALEDRPTLPERYATATASGDLTPRLAGLTDADILLAAGIAASKDSRRMLALKVYRMGVSGSLDGLLDVTVGADAMLREHMRKTHQKPMPAMARQQLIVDTLNWWLKPTCGYCNGTRFVEAMVDGTDEGAGRLTTKACGGCHGTGKRPLAREVPQQLKGLAEWLAGELDRLVALIHAEMAKLLGQRLDLP
ncbi:MAG TPA: hypothetical protein VGF12_00965 [Roseateles sp.]|uniref:hypothetical protein n=1 Tax=Roseateles sp. TaxID=1971397 RepID=UPI002ED8A06A